MSNVASTGRERWTRSTLGDVLTVLRGVAYKKEQSAPAPFPGSIPVLRATNIQSGLTFDELVHVPRSCVSDEQLLRVGDIVVAASSGSRSIVGKAAPLNATWFGSFGAFCFGLRPKADVAPRFLAWFLQTSEYRNRVSELAAGVNINNLRARHIEETPIALPPLDEQRRIVAEIEKQFTRLDAGVAALRRVQANLKRYRASVLKSACEGRLVPTEASLARAESRPFESGADLLQRILAERRAKWTGRGKYKEPSKSRSGASESLPDAWAWTTVAELNPADRPCAYGVLQPGADVNDGVSLVRVGDVDNGRIEVTGLKRIAPSIAARYPRTTLRGGEVLITLVGAVGRTAVAPPELAGANTARAVGVIPLTADVSARWVELWFRNPAKVAAMVGAAHEVARKTLNLEDVRAATIALPPLAEQHRIVEEVERRLSVIDALETVCTTNLQRATRLRQSILQRAFTGAM